ALQQGASGSGYIAGKALHVQVDLRHLLAGSQRRAPAFHEVAGSGGQLGEYFRVMGIETAFTLTPLTVIAGGKAGKGAVIGLVEALAQWLQSRQVGAYEAGVVVRRQGAQQGPVGLRNTRV